MPWNQCAKDLLGSKTWKQSAGWDQWRIGFNQQNKNNSGSVSHRAVAFCGGQVWGQIPVRRESRHVPIKNFEHLRGRTLPTTNQKNNITSIASIIHTQDLHHQHRRLASPATQPAASAPSANIARSCGPGSKHARRRSLM